MKASPEPGILMIVFFEPVVLKTHLIALVDSVQFRLCSVIS